MIVKDTFPETFRWSAYFAMDAANGGKIKKRYESDLRAFRHGTSVRKTQAKLRDLLRHASSTTAFYKDMDPDAGLASFPVVDRELIRRRRDDFISSAYADGRGCRIRHTNGRNDLPLAILQDARKVKMNAADGIFLASLANYYIGEKMAMIRVWSGKGNPNRVTLHAENMLRLDCSSLSDEKIADMLNTIRSKHVKAIIGYSPALALISNYIDRYCVDMDDFEVHSIIPITEPLTEEIRSALMHQFNCTVQAWYASEENGIIGIQDPIENRYYMNAESYYVEILKMDSDEPCEDGEEGRVVITDLNNRAFPLIRYANGDLARAHHVVKNGHYRMSIRDIITGAADPLYSTRGELVSVYAITNELWDLAGVKNYQLVQKGVRSYELRLAGERSLMDIDGILDRIRPVLGADANIEVSFPDDLMTCYGKNKVIVNECPEYLKIS